MGGPKGCARPAKMVGGLLPAWGGLLFIVDYIACMHPLPPFKLTFREYIVVFNGNHRPEMYGATGGAVKLCCQAPFF